MVRFLPARALALLTLAAVVSHSPAALSGEFDVVVSEIHYGPLSGEAADEFVELENHGPTTVNLAGWRFTEGISFVFPPGTLMEPRSYLVVSPNAAHARSRHAIANVVGDFTGKLDNDGEILTLENARGELICRLHYGDGGAWPSSPDGSGPSLELWNPGVMLDLPGSWVASLLVGGTPGGPNSRATGCGRSAPAEELSVRAVINEVKPTEPGDFGFIEIYNPTDTVLSLSRHAILDSAGHRFDIPGAVSIAARGRLLLSDSELGFPVSLEGVTHVLAIACASGGLARFVDALSTRAGRPGSHGSSFGRYPDGDDDGFAGITPSPGRPNEAPALSAVTINEVYFHPPYVPPTSPCAERCSDALQWIEVHNHGAVPIELAGWSVGKAVDLKILSSTRLSSGEFLVLAASRAAFLDAHPGFEATRVVGDWKRRLSHGSDTIHLLDAIGNRVDRVQYGDGTPFNDLSSADGQDDGTFLGSSWPHGADGTGRSIELRNPRLDNRHGAAWAVGPLGGTPGAANLSLDASPSAVIDDVSHAPAVPGPLEPIKIRCRVSSTGRVESVEALWHRESSAAKGAVALSDDGLSVDDSAFDGEFSGLLPPQPDGAVVAFQVRARLVEGSVFVVPQAPAVAPYPGFEGPFFLLQALASPPLSNGSDNYHVILTRADSAELEARPVSSDILLPCTFISVKTNGDSRIRHLAGIRYRGGQTREDPRKSFRIDFPAERTFQSIEHLNLNASHAEREILVADLFRRAGMPYPRTWMVNLTLQGRVDSSYVYKESFDSDFLSRYFGGSSDSGNLYRALDPNVNPETGELDFRSGDLSYYGPSQGDYKRYYKKHSNREEGDYADIVALCRTFDSVETPDTLFPQAIESVIDTAEWLRYFALQSFVSNGDGGIYNRAGEDYFLYRVPATSSRPDAGKWLILPWDLDESFSNAAQRFYLFELPSIRRLLTHPRFAPLYYAHIVDIRSGVGERRELKKRLSLLEPLLGFYTTDLVDSFLADRIGFVDWNIPLELSAGPVSGAFGCGTNLYAVADAISLSGTARATQTRSVKVGGVLVPYDPVGASWSANVSILSGENRIALEAFDGEKGTGSRIESKTISIFRWPGPPSTAQGILSGITRWTAAEGPYLLTGAVTIPAGSRLEIEPGTLVLGGPDAPVIVEGEFQAIGTEAAPILFRPIGCQGRWGGISFQTTGATAASPTHTMRFCDVLHAQNVRGLQGAIACVSSRLVVERCSLIDVAGNAIDGVDSHIEVRESAFVRTGEGVHASYSTVIIVDSTFSRLIGNSDAIDFDFSGPGRSSVERCWIDEGGDDGIDLTGVSVDLRDNTVRRLADKAFSLEIQPENSPPTITGNLVYDCGGGIVLKNGTLLSEGGHNTVVGCEEGIRLYSKDGWPQGATASFHSTIVWHNVVDVSVDSLSSLTMTHSNTGGGILPGVGNVSIDPQFVSAPSGDYALRALSPCKATGKGGADMGAIQSAPETRRYLRGDSDGNGAIQITDAIHALLYLFNGGSPPGCLKSADVDDNGSLEITDSVLLLNYLFLGGRSPPAPFPGCGLDPTPDDLSCRAQGGCR